LDQSCPLLPRFLFGVRSRGVDEAVVQLATMKELDFYAHHGLQDTSLHRVAS
jgi:hypothetical protein